MNEIGTVYKDYPHPVQELVGETMHILDKHNMLDEVDAPILEKMLSDNALKKFFAGSDMSWGEDEFLELLAIAEIHTHIEYLKEQKFIDSIEDENGEEIIWPTELGKTIINQIINDDRINS